MPLKQYKLKIKSISDVHKMMEYASETPELLDIPTATLNLWNTITGNKFERRTRGIRFIKASETRHTTISHLQAQIDKLTVTIERMKAIFDANSETLIMPDNQK
jgi:hypothetical protein